MGRLDQPEPELQLAAKQETEETPEKVRAAVAVAESQKAEADPDKGIADLDLEGLMKARTNLLKKVEVANSLVELKLTEQLKGNVPAPIQAQNIAPELEEPVAERQPPESEAERKRNDLFRKKLQIVDEIKERVQGSSGRDICRAKMAQMLQNAAKNTVAARIKIREQIEQLRSRPRVADSVPSIPVSTAASELFAGVPIPEDSLPPISYSTVPPIRTETVNRTRSAVDCGYRTANPMRAEVPSQIQDWDRSEEMQIIKTLNENDEAQQYDDSLFTIIDEIEASEPKPTTTRPESPPAVSPFSSGRTEQCRSAASCYSSQSRPMPAVGPKVYYPRVQQNTLSGYSSAKHYY